MKNKLSRTGGKRTREIIERLRYAYPHAKIVLRFSNNWELLVAVILSAQCTDKKVNEVTARLFKKYRGLDDYVKASASWRTVREFELMIKPTGFYRTKAKNILRGDKEPIGFAIHGQTGDARLLGRGF